MSIIHHGTKSGYLLGIVRLSLLPRPSLAFHCWQYGKWLVGGEGLGARISMTGHSSLPFPPSSSLSLPFPPSSSLSLPLPPLPLPPSSSGSSVDPTFLDRLKDLFPSYRKPTCYYSQRYSVSVTLPQLVPSLCHDVCFFAFFANIPIHTTKTQWKNGVLEIDLVGSELHPSLLEWQA